MKKRKSNYFVGNIVSGIFIASFLIIGIFFLVMQFSLAKAAGEKAMITRGNWTLARQYVFTANEPIAEYSLNGGRTFITIDPPVGDEYTVSIGNVAPHKLVLKDADGEVSDEVPIRAKQTGNDNAMFYASKELLPWEYDTDPEDGIDSNWEYMGTGAVIPDVLDADGNCIIEYGDNAFCYKIYNIEVYGEQVKVLKQLDNTSTGILEMGRLLDVNDYNNLYKYGGSFRGEFIVPVQGVVELSANVSLQFESLPNSGPKRHYSIGISYDLLGDKYVQINVNDDKMLLNGEIVTATGGLSEFAYKPKVTVGEPLDFEIRIPPSTGEVGILPMAQLYVNARYMGSTSFATFDGDSVGDKVSISTGSIYGKNREIFIQNFGIQINTGDIDVLAPVSQGFTVVDNPIYTFSSDEEVSGYQVNDREWITVEPNYQITDIPLNDGLNDLRVRDISGNIATYNIYVDTIGPSITLNSGAITTYNENNDEPTWIDLINVVDQVGGAGVDKADTVVDSSEVDMNKGGTYTVYYNAVDGIGNVGDTFSINITIDEINDAPTIDRGIDNKLVYLGTPFSIGVPDDVFNDEEDAVGTLIYSIVDVLDGTLTSIPAHGVTVNGTTKAIEGQFNNEDMYTIEIKATDSGGLDSATLSFTVTTTATNTAIVLNNEISDQVAIEDIAWSYKFPIGTFLEIDGDTISYSAYLVLNNKVTELPSSIIFDKRTGKLSATFTNQDLIDLFGAQIKIVASDGLTSATDTFKLTIEGVNDAPVVENIIPRQDAKAGIKYQYIIPDTIFKDQDLGDVLTYTITRTGTASNWLIFDGAKFSGTPTISDLAEDIPIVITLTATDSGGLFVEDEFPIYVTDNTKPEIISAVLDNDGNYNIVTNTDVGSYKINNENWIYIPPTSSFAISGYDNGTYVVILRDTTLNQFESITFQIVTDYDQILPELTSSKLINSVIYNITVNKEITVYVSNGGNYIDVVPNSSIIDGVTLQSGENSIELRDKYGNIVVETVTYDNVSPVIDPVDGVEIYTEDVPETIWTAPTATANDDTDGDISDYINVEYYKADGTTLLGGDNIQETARNELKAGRDVVVKYNVSDIAGNAAEEICATFVAIDNIAPIIISNHWFYKENYDLIANENIIEYKINDNGWIKTSEPTQIVPLTLDLGSKKDIKVYNINVKDVEGNVSTEPFILKYRTAEELDHSNPEIELEGYEGNDIIINIVLDDISSWSPPVSKVRDEMDFDIVVIVSYYKAVGDGDTSLADLDAARKELAAGRDVIVKYNASDDAGNSAEEVKVTVTTRDITLPEIEQVQGAVIKIEGVSDWIAPIAKVTDNIDADFTVEGQYHKTDGTTIDLDAARKELEAERDVVVKYNATDNAGNEAEEVKARFTRNDNTAPVIIIAGVEVNTEDAASWTAPKATVTDNIDKDFTVEGQYYKSDGTSIDLEAARTELKSRKEVVVKYNAVDAAGNIADEVEATFTANDNTAPVIEPVDGAEVSKEQSASWTAPQTTASDNVDGILTGSIKVTYFKADGTTVLASLTYARQELAVGRRALVKYNVSDAAGNVADEVKVTFIPDNEAPVIVPVNGGSVNIENASSWTAPKATATDEGVDISERIVVTYYKADGSKLLDEETARTELAAGRSIALKYNVSDEAGNEAYEVEATFKADNEAPVILSVDGRSVNIETAKSWTAPKAIAVDGTININERIVVTYYTADESILLSDGETAARTELTEERNVVVKYNVSDEAGNDADEVRTTFKADNKAPVIGTVGIGGGPVSILANPNWTAPIPTAIDGPFIISDRLVIKYYTADGSRELTGEATEARQEFAAGRSVLVKYNLSDEAGNAADEVEALFTPDTDKPVIGTVNGGSVNIVANPNWKAPSTTASDTVDGDISDDIEIKYYKANGWWKLTDGETDARKELEAGRDVVVKYNVRDAAGNAADEVEALFTQNTDKPEISPVDGGPVSIVVNPNWTAPTPIAMDGAVDISDRLVIKYYTEDGTELLDEEAARQELLAGRYVVVKYNFSDEAGNDADEVEAKFTPDNEKPVIGAVDGGPVSIVVKPNWTAPKPTAMDGTVDISERIVVTYYKADGLTLLSDGETLARTELTEERNVVVKYNISDAAGNVADEVSAIFKADNEAPVIVPVDGGSVNIENTSSWTAPKAIATDDAVDISERIVVTYYKADGSTLLSGGETAARQELAAGRSVLVKYNVSDVAGNVADEVEATFTAGADKTKPVINPVTGGEVNTENADTWTAPIATANDNKDGNISDDIVITYYKADGTLLTDLAKVRVELKAGRSVVVKYNVSDTAGNVATEVTATFTAIDNTPPVIEPVAGGTVALEDISSWEAPETTANDNLDGNISDNIEIKYFDKDENLLTDMTAIRAELTALREIIVKYNVTDTAGNEAEEVSTTFTTKDTAAPTIEIEDAEINTEDALNWTPIAVVEDNIDTGLIAMATYFNANKTIVLANLVAAREELAAGRDVVVKYKVSDAAGNAAEVSAIFTAIDNTLPVIDPVIGGTVNTENADTWTAPIATASDNKDGNLTEKIEIKYFNANETNELADLAATRRELKAGNSIVVKYKVSDEADNIAEVSATFTALDNTEPIFAPVLNKIIKSLEIETWIAPSTTASDNVDNNLTGNIEVKYYKADGISTINLATARIELKAGRKVVVKYTVSDVAGNTATEVAEFRTTVEGEPKIINSKNVTYSSRFRLESNIPIKQYTIDNGVSWKTVTTANKKITITFPIIGEYRVIVKDEIGNESPVKVIRYLPKPSGGSNSKMPSISLEGATTITLKVGTVYSEPGYTATAADGTDITSSVEVNSNFNKDKIGSYTIVYKVTNNGQIKITTRVVKVIDTVGPQITLNGSAITYVALNGIYNELGVEVFDYSQTEEVVIFGTINTNIEGTYTIIYKVRDVRGNQSTATRTVIVVSSTIKIIDITIDLGAQEIKKEISSPLLSLEGTKAMYIISELKPTIYSNWLTESELAEIIFAKENSYLYILLMAENGAYEIQQLDKLNICEKIKICDNNKIIYGVNKKTSTLDELVIDEKKDK